MDNPDDKPKAQVRVFCCPQCGMEKGLTAVGRATEIRTCELCDLNDTSFLYDLNSVPTKIVSGDSSLNSVPTKIVSGDSSSDWGCVVLILGLAALYVLAQWLLK